jgi:hypothetical protein
VKNIVAALALILIATTTPAIAANLTPTLTIPAQDTATLYRNSATMNGSTMRIHVATFDVDSTSVSGTRWDYNGENCQIAADLFQRQPGVKVRYWCERGRFKP